MAKLMAASCPVRCMDWVTPHAGIKPERPLFVCILSNTDTAKIPGISGAGRSPELTEYTPASDAEIVAHGRVVSAGDVPATPHGTPTPAVITRAALQLAGIPHMFIDAGLRVRPRIPLISVGASPARDIRCGSAVPDVESLYSLSRALGQQLSRISDFVVIGESVPGGTTTALGVLRALGYDGHVSSSLKQNPVELKNRVVDIGMRAAHVSFGSLRASPLRAISCLGDSMMACAAGLVDGLSVKTVLGGGTQMLAVLAVIKHLGLDRDVSIATTTYVSRDTTASFNDIAKQLGYTAYLADPGLGNSSLAELRNYELGDVKEGVGAGGALFAASLMGVGQNDVLESAEIICRDIFTMKP